MVRKPTSNHLSKGPGALPKPGYDFEGRKKVNSTEIGEDGINSQGRTSTLLRRILCAIVYQKGLKLQAFPNILLENKRLKASYLFFSHRGTVLPYRGQLLTWGFVNKRFKDSFIIFRKSLQTKNKYKSKKFLF